MEVYRILNRILSILYCYTTYHDTLPAVCKDVVKEMKSYGYDVAVTDDRHRDYRLITVDGHLFRIVRERGWMRYDVILIN